MTTYKMILSYDGSRYSGWQRQGNTNNTIQEKLEKVLEGILGVQIEAAASGRTDEGVHALGQVVSFRTEKEENCEELLQACNRYLPQDIRVLSLEYAYPRFHARLNAVGKWYDYRIDHGKIARVFERKYVTRVEEPLDLNAMKEAAAFLLGEHDYASFCDNHGKKKSTVRRVDVIDMTDRDGILTISFHGDGFLYHMVRIMTGTLLEVGQGKRSAYGMIRVLEAKDRKKAGFLAPAQGLFLREVEY
ncbi:MAG: tRNA pseudouridine(38-40) synthase TruA [Clostridiales bacterium]|nr:tRNA pseudouridine(38-40) synthase TruA [Clostridiales bacterium]